MRHDLAFSVVCSHNNTCAPTRNHGVHRCHSYVPAGGAYPQPSKEVESGLLSYYWLDAASLLPPLMLGVQPGQQVLDMCAAPGGKSFVLAQLLFAGTSPGPGLAPALTASNRSSAATKQDGELEACNSSSPTHEVVEVAKPTDSPRHVTLAGVGSKSGSAAGESSGSDADDAEQSSDTAKSARLRHGQTGAGLQRQGPYLVVNDADAGRKARLAQVLNSYVPQPARSTIRYAQDQC